MKTYTLKATPRTLTGTKVKNLRKEGMLPATVYGKGVKSASLSVKQEEFETVLSQAGETGLVELSLDKEKRSVLIHSVARHAVTNIPLHVEFHQVDLKEKVHAKIPVKIEGESPAVLQRLGVLLPVLNEVEIEALPTELPEHVSVDVSTLLEVDQELKVSDLVFAPNVKVLTDTSLTVVKVGALITKEAEVQAAADTAASEAAAATGEEAKATEAAAETPEAKAETPEKTTA